MRSARVKPLLAVMVMMISPALLGGKAGQQARLPVPPAAHQVITRWQAGTGPWGLNDNWEVGEPSSDDTAFITNGGTAEISQAGETCWELHLGRDLGQSGTVSMTSGQLSSGGRQYVGHSGTGTFTQTGGTNALGGLLIVAHNPGSDGTYTLSGTGELTVSTEYMGASGTGTFTQTGGIHSVTSQLFVGQQPGSRGTYELHDTGDLSVNAEHIGWKSIGEFTQTGGTHTVTGRLYLGSFADGDGTYTLSGDGQLSANTEDVGNSGTGEFTQTGGTNTVFANLYIGTNPGATGTYTLSGAGEVSANFEYIGHEGTGTFIQTGGTHSVTNWIYVGRFPGSSGTYVLSDTGELSANEEQIGRGSTGEFTQTGGTNTVTTSLYLGTQVGGDGTYTMSGGHLSAGSLFVGVDGAGTLNITGAGALIEVSTLLSFGVDSTFTATTGSTIHMTGSNFENESNNEASLIGLSNLTLIFEGGASDVDLFEAAGTVEGGFVNNFAAGSLTLGGVDIGRVQLVDDFDNGNRSGGSECLFVHSLTIGAGSSLDVNGLRLFVEGDVEAVLDGWIVDGRLFDGTLVGGDTLDAVYDPAEGWTTLLLNDPEPLDCNANGLPDECDLDCGLTDGPCDIAGCGGSADCQPLMQPGHGTPDECDIAGCDGGPDCSDCNLNGVPDWCDIDSETSQDVNLDGVPDECVDTAESDGNWTDDIWGLTGKNAYPDNIDGVSGLSVTLNDVNVTVDEDIEVETLSLLGGAELNVSQGDLTVVADGGILIDGASTSGDNVTTTIVVGGDDSVSSTNLEVVRGGRVASEGSARTDLSGKLTAGPGGLYAAKDGATNVSASLNAQSVEIIGGTCIPYVDGGAVRFTDEMSAVTTGDLVMSGAPQNGCSPRRGGCDTPPPRLRVGDSLGTQGGMDTLHVGGSLLIASSTKCAAVYVYGVGAASGSQSMPVAIEGDFLNYTTLPDGSGDFDWTEGGLALVGVGPHRFELTGRDFGPFDTGFVSNFAMGAVRIDTGAVVTFVDEFDNDWQGQVLCEALYVDTLIVDSGATLITNGCRVYYRNLINNGGLIESLGSDILNVPDADYDDDGNVDLDDFDVFLDCLAGPGAEPDPTVSTTPQSCLDHFDADHDQDIDAADFAYFQGVFTLQLHK